MILLLLIVLGVILWYSGILVHRGGNSEFQPFSRKSAAMDIAKRRYAGGEIEKEEFETLRKDLAE